MATDIRLKQPTFTATAFRFASWRLLLLILALAGLYLPVLVRLAVQWYQNPDYSHGFFVPFLAGYMVWRKRSALAKTPRVPSWLGFPIVMGALGLLFLGSLGAELFLTRISLWFAIVGLILYFQGSRRLFKIAFPIAFLLFMIPLPAIIYIQIVFPLQLLASSFASRFLQIINFFPVLREGNLLILPNYTLEVVDACSGIRSLIALLALGSAYSYFKEHNQLLRIILVALMVPLAVVANAFRVILIAFCTQFWGSQAAEGLFHPLAGIMVFVVATSLLITLHITIDSVRRRFGAAIP
jgi:exosortase